MEASNYRKPFQTPVACLRIIIFCLVKKISIAFWAWLWIVELTTLVCSFLLPFFGSLPDISVMLLSMAYLTIATASWYVNFGCQILPGSKFCALGNTRFFPVCRVNGEQQKVGRGWRWSFNCWSIWGWLIWAWMYLSFIFNWFILAC